MGSRRTRCQAAIPGTQSLDRNAIDWYLDQASRLLTGETASNDPDTALAEWRAQRAGR